MNENYLIFNALGILTESNLKQVSQGNHNVDYFYFGYYNYDYTTSYVTVAITLPNGVELPELATSQKDFEFNEAKYKGYMIKFPETITAIAGTLTMTIVLKNMQDDTELFSSQLNVTIHETDNVIDPTITKLQYNQMQETIREEFAEVQRKLDLGLEGTADYNDLVNKPKINGIELSGDISVENLGLTYDDTEIRKEINEVEKQIPKNISQLNNDSGFITQTIDNLTNYYTKTQTYNKDEINSIVNNIQSFNALIVVELPTENISTTTIYLIPKMDNENNDYYDEYLYINNSWEMIGNTKIDLSDYYTKKESDNRYISTVQSSSLNLSNINATKKEYTFYNGIGNVQTPISISTYEYGEAFYYNDDEIHLTPGKSGLMSPLEKGKLDRIDESANNFAQEEYEKGLNILNLQNVASTTVNGITYSFDNGVINLNGTATADVEIWLENSEANYTGIWSIKFFNEGSYSGGNIGFYTAAVGVGGWVVDTWNFNSNTSSFNGTTTRVRVIIQGGTTCTNYVIKPMLVNGSIVPNAYFPYNGQIIHEKDILNLKYLHNINLISDAYRVWIRLYSDRSTSYTIVELSKWLYKNGYNATSTAGIFCSCSGGNRNINRSVYGLSSGGNDGSNRFMLGYVADGGTTNEWITFTTITDNVIELFKEV